MASKQEQKVIAAALAGGDGAHIARLAESYYYGRGRDKNLKTALQLWERAAELGNAEALYYCGVSRDKDMAFAFWEQAAQLGHAGAQMSLDTLRPAQEQET